MHARSGETRFALTPLAAGLSAILAVGIAGASSTAPSRHTPIFPHHAQVSGALQRVSRTDPRLDLANRYSHRIEQALAQTRARRAPVHPSGGASISVATCDENALRDAVDSAANGDTVDLSQPSHCTITLTAGELSSSVDYLTLQGPADGSVTIDGRNASRIIADADGYGMLTIDHLTLQNGKTAEGVQQTGNYGYYYTNSYGGCVYTNHSSITLSNSTVTGCTVGDQYNYSFGNGGGVAAAHGSVALVNSTVSGNVADGGGAGGGGVFAKYDATVDGSTVADNIAIPSYYYYGGTGGGGGVLSKYGNLTVSRQSTISGNAAAGNGGGAYAFGYGVYISDSTLENNYSGNSGGGAMGFKYLGVSDSVIAFNTAARAGGGLAQNSAYPASIVRSTISGNSARFGGGLFNGSGALTQVSGSTFSGNEAYYSGGAIYSFGSTLSLSNSTISGNSTLAGTPYEGYYGDTLLRGGAGIFSSGDNLTIHNSTVAFNSATVDTGGGGIALSSYAVTDPTAYTIDITSTIVSNNTATAGAGDLAGDTFVFTIAGSADLIVDADSASATVPTGTLTSNPILQPLADNGGPTWTHALGEGSPAIDAGSNPDALDFDQRGDGFAREVGGTADIGAFESGNLNDVIFKDGFDTATPPPE